LCICTREERDDLRALQDGAWPTMREDERDRIGRVGTDVDEVKQEAIDSCGPRERLWGEEEQRQQGEGGMERRKAPAVSRVVNCGKELSHSCCLVQL
jgi:hypothetical protein